MSTTTAEMLQLIASVGGYIVVLRSPTAKYKEYIAVCGADGVAISILTREILDGLVEANLVKRDHEDESKVIFELTDYGKEAAKTPLEKYLTAKLISLGYPWPDNLENKSTAWLEAEIQSITPALKASER
jgi:DNA-binding PadR family transcriptional regulator